MTEEWKEVYGFDVLYEVSNLGRVRTKYVNKCGYTREYRFVNATTDERGYYHFAWGIAGKQRTVYLHRLVAEYFCENPCGYNEINHKDENKANNNASNLEWCNHKYNCNYGTRNERAAEKNRVAIRCNESGMIFNSVKDAANYFGVGVSAISNCLKKRSKTSRGHTFSYVDA